MTDIDDHDPRHLTDQDIAALLDEGARETPDHAHGQPESVLDVGALETLVLEEETNLASLLPGFVPDEAPDAVSLPAGGIELDAAAQLADVPVLQSLNILFGFDGEDQV